MSDPTRIAEGFADTSLQFERDGFLLRLCAIEAPGPIARTLRQMADEQDAKAEQAASIHEGIWAALDGSEK